MPKLKISPPPFPNREEYPFTASVRYRGMVIDIENLDGSVREGTNPNGKSWRTKFNGCHYGELRGSLGTDGDKLDVYIKSNPDDGANKAYIIHQNHPRTHPTKAGEYDEDKVILGVSSLEDAKELYLQHYDRKDYLRSVTEMPIEKFKRVAFGENKGEKVASETSTARAKELGSQIGIDWGKVKFPVEQLRMGINVEREHGNKLGKNTDVGADQDATAARIAWAHLKEIPDYYTRLDKMEKSANGDEEEGPGKPINKATVNAWLAKNPNPTDDKMHEFAESQGYNVHKLETYIYSLATKAVKKEGSSFIRQKMREGGSPMNIEKIKEAACKTPGKKIRSGGKGRGAGEGRGHGPMGVPLGAKGMAGKEKKMNKTSEVTEAYQAGAQAALDDYLKEAAQKGFQTVLKKLPGSPPVMGKIPEPPKVGPDVKKMAEDIRRKLAADPRELRLNRPGSGMGQLMAQGIPYYEQTQALGGPASTPTYAQAQMGQRIASPEWTKINPPTTQATTQKPAVQKPEVTQPTMVAAAGGKPRVR